MDSSVLMQGRAASRRADVRMQLVRGTWWARRQIEHVEVDKAALACKGVQLCIHLDCWEALHAVLAAELLVCFLITIYGSYCHHALRTENREAISFATHVWYASDDYWANDDELKCQGASPADCWRPWCRLG